MNNLMQEFPLMVGNIIDHAARYHPNRKIISRTVEGPIETTNWTKVRHNALKLTKALLNEKFKSIPLKRGGYYPLDYHKKFFLHINRFPYKEIQKHIDIFGGIYYMNNFITLDGIGLVHFYKSKKAKRLIISITKNNEIKVAVPIRIDLNKAVDFAQSKINWIKKTQDKISKKIIITNNHYCRSDAKKILVRRLNEISNDTGLSYNKVSIRNQKTRWGSCSSLNNISLNIKLIALPPRLMDYVIFHELVHTVERNHSKKFWNLLNKYLPKSNQLNKELNNYAI